MNGVRRFLGASPAQQENPLPPVPPPTVPKAGPSWPPASPSSLSTATSALFLRKDKQKPPRSDSNDGIGSSSTIHSVQSSLGNASEASEAMSSPTRPGPNSSPGRAIARKSVTPDSRRSSSLLNTRDELLMSLLASEAVVDSREFDILSSEQVDDLKKEQQVLTSRLEAMSKKLTLETKIRDAAVSLTKVNAPHKKMSKQTDEQLEAANRRVDAAQKELWRVSERSNEVRKRLLEHRAGVLSFSVRSMERKMAPPLPQVNGNGLNGSVNGAYDSGYDTPMSPTGSSMTGVSSSSSATRNPRFDGAHLFAGHADAIVPTRKRPGDASRDEVGALEEKLKAATDALGAAGKKQGEMTRELQLLRLEKQEVETMMGMELQNAEDTIAALEKELPKLEGMDEEMQELREQKQAWEEERERLLEKEQEAEILKRRLDELEASKAGAAGAESLLAEIKEDARLQLEQKDKQLRDLQSEWDADRDAWERERGDMQDEKMEDLARLQEEMDRLRDEDGAALQKATQELDDGLAAVRQLVQTHGIPLFSRDSSLLGLLSSIGTHLEGLKSKADAHAKAESEWDALRRKLEDDVRSGLDKREAASRDIEEARREREEARRQVRSLEARVQDKASDIARSTPRTPSTPLPSLPSQDFNSDSAKIISLLQPIWSLLPSPEARAAKFSNQSKYRTGSPTPASPTTLAPNGVKSLSDLDVRSLKTLYDNKSAYPSSPNTAAFSIEAFAARVQSLITDDRALIERLVRFAQAHELLKKNAERAQKLAQESNNALETYQKQVRTLEERNMTISMKQAALQDEVQTLQDAVDRISAEKRDVEMQAAEQAETMAQLTDANNTLSARTLSLAEEAASAPEMIKRQLEAQLAEARASLEAAQDEVDAMRTHEQTQRIALLDELNTMQTENGQLRAQLRAAKR